ncbi:GIY-YIG nuclease family protein [Devosia sp.]|uniref:GIY-YIG nuclease family protein n=1 Tax=Devosia sp. TaxID=1871048 RepID=UPI003450A869
MTNEIGAALGLDPRAATGANCGMAWVYFMANRRFGTIYAGATNNLVRRVWEHRSDVVPGFTRTHQCHLLVWFEEHQSIYSAMQREHNIKHWRRDWKVALIEGVNPEWDDLYFQVAPG